MSDPFLDDLQAEEPERGPFRTADTTRDARLAKARVGSLDRVATKTLEIMESERRRERRLDVVYAILLGVSILGLASVFAVVALTRWQWKPLLCPAFAAVISFAIVALKRWVGRPET